MLLKQRKLLIDISPILIMSKPPILGQRSVCSKPFLSLEYGGYGLQFLRCGIPA